MTILSIQIDVITAGGRGEAGAMYDQGDQEDKDIAAEQDRAAQLREELPEVDDANMPSPLPAADTPLQGTPSIICSL